MDKVARKKNVDVALGYSALDQGEPSEYCRKLLDGYIQGKLRPGEVTEKLIKEHKTK